MKNILSILFILLLSVTVFAQNPKLSYQSVVRDSENKLVVEQPITVTMNVLDAAGNSQFEQTLNATTNRNGLVSLEFGDETAAWSNIDWNGAKIRTAVAYDGNEMVDTAVVNAVPFALYANTVNTAAIPQSDWAETDNTKCTFILNKPSIADTVNNILTAGNYVTTATMDARGYLTSDSAVITTMQTNIASNTANIATNAGNIATNASNITTNANAIAAAVGKEKADSTTLAGRITDLESATMNCNDVKACIADTLSKYTTTDQLCNVVSTCDFSTNASLQNMLNELSSKLSATQTKLDSLSNSIDSIADIDPSHDGPAPRPFLCGDSLADHEGNMYKTMKINNWCWMAENLRCTTSPSTGTSILENPANSISYSGKKAYYVEGDATNTAIYGLLYNWCAAVDTFNTALGETSTNTNADNAVSATFYGHRRGICPEGWHLPTKNEWKQMGDYVAMQPQYNSQEGFYDNAKALSSKEGWSEDLSIAYDSPEQFWSPVHHPERNNATGFSAYPAGYYGINYGLRYNEFGVGVFFWTSNENTKSTATTENISFVSPNLGHVELSKSDGCSVRCLRDYLTVLINDIQKTDSTASSLSIRAVCKVTKPITSATISAYTDSACTNLAGTCTPSISYSSTSLGADLTGVITGLTTVNQYWIRVTATTENDSTAREAGPFRLLDEVFTECGTSRVTDPDGNKYSTVQIGDQCWMAENLRTTVGLTENSDYWHANEQDTNDLKYGLLYNWAAVMQGDASSATNPSGVQGICPEGWHVPSKAEWNALTTAVGSNDAYKCDGDNNIARALASTFGWTADDTYVCTPVEAPSSNNATGFAAAPTGYFLSDPANTYYGFNDFRYAANFWSTTDNDDKANVFFISGYVKFPSISEYSKTDGYSVRCVYGSEDPRVMSVTTDSVNDITSDLATLYGNVTDLGGNASVNAGFKYGTSETAMNTKVDNPVSATGLYSINITGLAGTTTYYFKAYAATNATDTAWGEVKSFITLPEPIAAADEMSVTTDSASTVTSSASTLYGNVKRLGGNASVTVGFKYGKCTCSMDSVKNISVNTTGSYHVAISNLAPATTYSYAAFITTGVNDTVWGDTLSFTTPSANPCSGQAIVTDHEGNQYSTVQIGDQCWMAQNLRVTTSPVSGHTLTESTDTSTLASYYSQNSKYCGEGYLYNWRAAMDLTVPAKDYTSEQSNYRGLCPEGWHIPTDSEWNTFATLFANDETFRTYFALIPAGYRAYDKDLHTSAIVFDEGFEGNEDGYSFFWSATPEADQSQTHVYNRFTSDDEILHQGGYKKEYQLSIRCLRNVVGD